MMKELRGTGVALVTPFKADLSVDIEALERLVEFQINNGVDYLVVLGTTGESATLEDSEKKQVIQTVVRTNRQRLPLVLGIGGNNTAAVTYEMQKTDLKDFAAILSVSPYYNKPSQEGIYRHYEAVASASPKPVIVYNVPGRTGSNIQPNTVKRMAENLPKIVGIKEAAGDILQAMQLKSVLPEDFLLISGDDMITLPMILCGGHGVISVIAQGFPKAFSEMVRLGLRRKVDEAYSIHYELAPSIDLIFAEGNPVGIKALLSRRKILENHLRLPLVRSSEVLDQKIDRFTSAFEASSGFQDRFSD